MNKFFQLALAAIAALILNACGVQQGPAIDDPGQMEEEKDTTPLPSTDPAEIHFDSMNVELSDPLEKLPDVIGWNIKFSYKLSVAPPKDRGLNLEVLTRYNYQQPYVSETVISLDNQQDEFLLTGFPRGIMWGITLFYRVQLRDNKGNTLQTKDGGLRLP
jgi:hypothetical protein